MRRTITVAAVGVALAATFAPLSPASAVCDEWYYELTGQCSPCHTANAADQPVEDETGLDLIDLICDA